MQNPKSDESKAKSKTINKLFALHHVLANREKFTKADALVLAILSEYTSGIYGTAWPAVDTIAEVGRLDVRTVQKALRRLEDAGIIHTVEGGGRDRPNTYRVQFDAVERSPFTARIKRAAERARNEGSVAATKPRRKRHPFEEETPAPFALNPGAFCTKPRRKCHPNPSEESKEIKPSAYAGSPCGDPLIQNNARHYENVGGRLAEIERSLKSNQPRRLEANHLQQLRDWCDFCDATAETYDGKVGDKIGGWALRLADELQGRIEDATEDIETELAETETGSEQPIAWQGKSAGESEPGQANVDAIARLPNLDDVQYARKARIFISRNQSRPPSFWPDGILDRLVALDLLSEAEAEKLGHERPPAAETKARA